MLIFYFFYVGLSFVGFSTIYFIIYMLKNLDINR